MSRPPPGTRADYRAFRTLPTRWMDNDEYGHMNNATYMSLIDTAVSLWQLDNGIRIRGPEALRLLTVENGCRYHSETGFPDLVHAGLRIGHLGTSSVRFEVGLFRNDETVASAEGFFTQVLTGDDGRPTAIPGAIRSRLSELSA